MKILLWGLGSIGRRHAQIIKDLYPETELIALRSSKGLIDQEENPRVENVFDIQEAMDHKPDAVFITNPTSMHIYSAITAAENGCHIFIEKPLSHNMKDIDKLIRTVKEKKLITLMGCNMRFNPILIKVKEMIHKRQLGTLLSFRISCGSYLPDWRSQQDYRRSYSARRDLGGGVVLDLIHELDYAYWIFGEFVDYKSFVGKISDLELETEDYAEILVKTNQNVAGSIHLDYFRKMPQRIIEVICKNGVIKGDMISNILYINNAGEEDKIEFNFDRDFMYREQLKHFIDCIQNNKETFNPIETGYNVLKYALGIKNGSE